VQEFSKDKPFCRNTQITLKGRGGTDFTPVFEYITEKKIQPKVLLYYTDGCGTYPEKKPEYPVIWLLTEKVSVPWGKKIIL
jgi:predicted metal-dependent peptidase